MSNVKRLLEHLSKERKELWRIRWEKSFGNGDAKREIIREILDYCIKNRLLWLNGWIADILDTDNLTVSNYLNGIGWGMFHTSTVVYRDSLYLDNP